MVKFFLPFCSIFNTYPGHGGEFEQRFFDAAIVIHMDRILEHEVDKVGCWLHKFVQLLQIL